MTTSDKTVAQSSPEANEAGSNAAMHEAPRSKTDEYTANVMMRLAKESYNAEQERYSSLSALATRMLTCISIVSIALITMLVPLLTVFGGTHVMILIWTGYTLIFGVLIAAFILAILSQWRFGYKVLASPQTFADQPVQLETALKAARYYCDAMEMPYQSMKDRNDTIRKRLTATNILMLVACGLIVVFAIVIAFASAVML